MPTEASLGDDFKRFLRDIFATKGQLDIAVRNARVAFLDGDSNPLALSSLDEAGVFDEHGQINNAQCKKLNITFNHSLIVLEGYETLKSLSDRERMIMASAIAASSDKFRKKCQDYLQTHPEELMFLVDFESTFSRVPDQVIKMIEQCMLDSATDSSPHLMTSPSSIKLIKSIDNALNSSEAMPIESAEENITLRRQLEINIRDISDTIQDPTEYMSRVGHIIDNIHRTAIYGSDKSKLLQLKKALDVQVTYHKVIQELVKENIDKDPMDGLRGVRENILKQIANVFPEDKEIFDMIKEDSMLVGKKVSSAMRATPQAFEDSGPAMNEIFKKMVLDIASVYSKISFCEPDKARYDYLVTQIKEDLDLIDTNVQTNFFRTRNSFNKRLQYFKDIKNVLNDVSSAFNIFLEIDKKDNTRLEGEIKQLHFIVDKRLAEIINTANYKAKIFLEQAEAYISSPERHWNTGYQWKKHRLVIEGKEYSIPKHVAKQLEEMKAAKLDGDYVTHMQNFINIGTKQANSFFKCFSSKSSQQYSTLFAHSKKKADIDLANKLLEEFSKSRQSSH